MQDRRMLTKKIDPNEDYIKSESDVKMYTITSSNIQFENQKSTVTYTWAGNTVSYDHYKPIINITIGEYWTHKIVWNSGKVEYTEPTNHSSGVSTFTTCSTNYNNLNSDSQYYTVALLNVNSASAMFHAQGNYTDVWDQNYTPNGLNGNAISIRSSQSLNNTNFPGITVDSGNTSTKKVYVYVNGNILGWNSTQHKLDGKYQLGYLSRLSYDGTDATFTFVNDLLKVS